jgi:G:T-mismatch repair DNA endonuclease (very short patch repair protein)
MDNLKYQDDRYDSGDMYAKSELENGRKNVLAIQGDQGEAESKDERGSVTKAHGKAMIYMPFKKGYCPSEEHKRKNSEAHKGIKNPFYGKHLSKEHRRKLSKALGGIKNPNYGKSMSIEQKEKISLANKGKHRTEEFKKRVSEKLKGRIPWNRGCQGLYRHSEEIKRTISERKKNKQREPFSEEWRKRIGDAQRGRHRSEETKKKLSKSNKGKHNPTEETRKKMSNARIKARKEGMYSLKPTTPEKKFMEICANRNLPFKYVGDGKFWIENVNPDFVESNGRKIAIEIYGDYWHNLPIHIMKDKRRTTTLGKYGWKLLILWEHELKELSENEIIRKVTEVCSSI